MEWLVNNVCWSPEHRVLINWAPGAPKLGTAVSRYAWEANLWLAAASDEQGCLIVHKDRYANLSMHSHALDEIFQEYELDANHFRGRVYLTQSEYTRWRLMWS